ncbi:MAG: hypothetical protein KBS82_05465 [Oscillospiraceae bacterium]|nr:hypothetical protein [Candidatus Limimonas egerieequi]
MIVADLIRELLKYPLSDTVAINDVLEVDEISKLIDEKGNETITIRSGGFDCGK